MHHLPEPILHGASDFDSPLEGSKWPWCDCIEVTPGIEVTQRHLAAAGAASLRRTGSNVSQVQGQHDSATVVPWVVHHYSDAAVQWVSNVHVPTRTDGSVHALLGSALVSEANMRDEL
jgi:hypothetical protein